MKNVTGILGVLLSVGYGLGAGEFAWGMGGAAPASPTPTSPGASCPATPVGNLRRVVVIKNVEAKSFTLPNGSKADVTGALSEILGTAASNSGIFIPDTSPPKEVGNCDQHLELTAVVSSIDLNNFQVGGNVRFGFNTGGSIPINGTVEGKVKFNSGTIAMELFASNCINGKCTAPARLTADQATAGLQINLDLDFGMIKTGPEFIANPQVNAIIRGIMMDGLKRLAASPDVKLLPWRAEVREFAKESGSVYFDAGADLNVYVGQKFEVVAMGGDINACNAYKVVGYIHVIRADANSSVALLDQSLDSRGIIAGDMVRPRL